MSDISIDLNRLLHNISYQLIISGIGFGLAGGILHFEASAVATALETTSGTFIVLSVLFYRLSQHEQD
ncbi:hypothetical protein [Halobaculum sp. EA56]|uniref:hypothetical protein n=1 Tax=Halobaculum sp. EA56 TaxID=3421648 RepID=UPI003EC0B171